MLTISAIVAVFMKLKEAIANNEELQNRLNVVMAAFKPIGNVVMNILDKLAEGLVWCAEKAVSFIKPLQDLGVKCAELVTKFTPFGAILKRFGVDLGETAKSMVDAANASAALTQQIERDTQSLTKAQRDFAEQSAQIQDEIAIIQDQMAEKENLTYEQRIANTKRINELRQRELNITLSLAKEELRIAEENAKLAPNSASDNEKLAQLKLKVANAQRALNQQVR